MTDEPRCFDCNETFDALVAFERTTNGYRGCPHCSATLGRLYEQRDEKEREETAELIDEAEPEEAVDA